MHLADALICFVLIKVVQSFSYILQCLKSYQYFCQLFYYLSNNFYQWKITVFLTMFLFVFPQCGVWWRDEDQSKTAKMWVYTHTDELCKKIWRRQPLLKATFIPELLVCRTMTERKREKMCFTVPVLTT